MSVSAWLVDIGYVVKASEGKFRLDYVEARRLVEERCGRTRAFLFNGFDPAFGTPSGLQRFYKTMEKCGMEVRLQPMESAQAGANRQRRVDVDLSVHLVWQASQENVKTLVLTTGDQDFVPAAEVVRERCGKRLVLFTYDRNVHRELAASVDDWWLFESEIARLARS
jgi:hypothetical protein